MCVTSSQIECDINNLSLITVNLAVVNQGKKSYSFNNC